MPYFITSRSDTSACLNAQSPSQRWDGDCAFWQDHVNRFDLNVRALTPQTLRDSRRYRGLPALRASVTTKFFSFIKGVKRPDTATNIKATPETINVGLIPIVSPNHPPKSAPNGIMPVTKKRKAPFILPSTVLGVRVCLMVQANTVIEEFPALKTK